jgi:flagellar basal body-associated protein FliL
MLYTGEIRLTELLGAKMKRILIIVVAALVVLYGAAVAYTYTAMCKSPAEFSEWINGQRKPMLAVVPFEPLWARARGGDLNVGDMAPDFDLETTDHSLRVRLSEFRGDRPVVLVFGSYT